MQRTMRLKLHPMPEQVHTLTATLAQCTDAFNWMCAYGWEHNEKNGVRLYHAQSVPPGGTIVHEDLTYIRCRVRARRGAGQRRLHAWSFAQWQRFVVYKAAQAGLDVVAIDPRHTSQTCFRGGR